MRERTGKKDVVEMTADYSNNPSLVPQAGLTQSGAVNTTAAPPRLPLPLLLLPLIGETAFA